MANQSCPQCGYLMSDFDVSCPRCAQGDTPSQGAVPTQIIPVNVTCPSCGQDNSNKRYACLHCSARLPVDLANIECLPLKEYQRRATDFGHSNDLPRAIATLNEAMEFYPDDVPTRNVLIGLNERIGDQSEVHRHQRYLWLMQLRASESFCQEQADAAYMRGDVAQALDIFEQGVQYHPNSPTLREGLAASLGQTGQIDLAHQQTAIAQTIRMQTALAHQHTVQHQSSGPSAGNVVAGAAIGTTGAVVGTGITVVSVIIGILVGLLGLCL